MISTKTDSNNPSTSKVRDKNIEYAFASISHLDGMNIIDVTAVRSNLGSNSGAEQDISFKLSEFVLNIVLIILY